jgi:Rho family protein
LVVVGLKTDLRHDAAAIAKLAERGEQPVSFGEAHAMAHEIGAKYAECSALKGDGVKAMFDLALREAQATLHRRQANVKSCALL